MSRGYATAGTDDGTSGPPSGAPAFVGNPDVLLDYGYRAVKATADNSKAIVTALMGQAPSRSYFVGCSDGGREALQEAQRYPNDFDGIIAGSPVNDQVGEFGASYLYNMQATLSGPQTNGVPDAYIPDEQAAPAHQRGTGAMRRQGRRCGERHVPQRPAPVQVRSLDGPMQRPGRIRIPA